MLKLILYAMTLFFADKNRVTQTIDGYTAEFGTNILEDVAFRPVNEVSAESDCPPWLKLVRNGECRGQIASFGLGYCNSGFEIAVSRCGQMGGQPVIIHDEEHALFFTKFNPRVLSSQLIGLVCNPVSTRWEWADGSPITYKPSIYDEALDKPCVPDCSWLTPRTNTNSTEWFICCKDRQTVWDISCIKQLHTPAPPGDGCDNFEHDSESGICGQVVGTPDNLQTAQEICRSVSANLTSIHSTQENEFIRRLALKNGAGSGLLIGGTRSDEAKSFEWMDGSKWNFDNFYPGFPHAGLGKCLAMDTSTATGQWMNVDCGTKLPMACLREKRALPPPTCSSDIYQGAGMITSPGYPFNATMPCDYFLAVEPGMRVKAEIVYLQANSCCDFLILYDGYLGGNMIANLTEVVRNATYTTTRTNYMRVSWQPRDGKNVKGMMMTFRGV